MPRPRFQRESCDCIDCNDLLRVPRAADQNARHSAALQDPPPKCLILYVDGALLPAAHLGSDAAASTSLDHAACPHLDGIVRDGCCGMLAVESPQSGSRLDADLDCLAQLFALDSAARTAPDRPPDLSHRFKQLAAAFVSSSEEAGALAAWAGFQSSAGLPQLVAGQKDAQPALSELPTPGAVAVAINGVLGLDAQRAEDSHQPVHQDADNSMDLLMLHLAPGSDASSAAEPSVQFADSCARLEWVDALVQRLNQQPSARDSLLLTLVLGSSGRVLPSEPPLLRPGSRSGGLRPRQSFELCRDEPVAVRMQAPLLTAQRLPAVVRVDACRQLSLADCSQRGGAGAILAERLLPELAYKLGRAPKYGA